MFKYVFINVLRFFLLRKLLMQQSDSGRPVCEITKRRVQNHEEVWVESRKRIAEGRAIPFGSQSVPVRHGRLPSRPSKILAFTVRSLRMTAGAKLASVQMR